MDYSRIKKPDLGYRYEFALDELPAARACVEAHGFAVIKKMLPDRLVEELQASVKQVIDPDDTVGAGNSYTHATFIEDSPALWKLFDLDGYLPAQRLLCASDALAILRSAAILRNPGSPPLAWHTDFCGFSDGPPQNANDVLNRGPWPSGLWFYVTGSHPSHGGLAVIEDSHLPDWTPPEGFQFTPDRRSFHRVGTEPNRYVGFDVPGLVPIFADPCDQIVFASQTYHAAFPNRTDRVRLSCAVIFRPRDYTIDAPWPLSDDARAFIGRFPQRLQPFVDGYVGFDGDWSGVGAAAAA